MIDAQSTAMRPVGIAFSPAQNNRLSVRMASSHMNVACTGLLEEGGGGLWWVNVALENRMSAKASSSYLKCWV